MIKSKSKTMIEDIKIDNTHLNNNFGKPFHQSNSYTFN